MIDRFRRYLQLVGLMAFIAAHTGCAAAVRYESPSLAHKPSGMTTSARSLGFLWGLVPPQTMSLEQCGSVGIKKMKVKQGFIDALITYATAGIVVSYKVKIACVEPKPA